MKQLKKITHPPEWAFMTKVGRLVVGFTMAGALSAGCGIGVKRNFNSVPTQAVIFDDMCGLQEYFDVVGSNKASGPAVVSASEFQKEDASRAAGGKTTFAFESEFQLKHLRRLLNEN